MNELEKRVEAIEAWIQEFEEDGERFLQTVEDLVQHEENLVEVVFTPAEDLLRNKKKDN